MVCSETPSWLEKYNEHWSMKLIRDQNQNSKILWFVFDKDTERILHRGVFVRKSLNILAVIEYMCMKITMTVTVNVTKYVGVRCYNSQWPCL